jgi:hypothetical protein
MTIPNKNQSITVIWYDAKYHTANQFIQGYVITKVIAIIKDMMNILPRKLLSSDSKDSSSQKTLKVKDTHLGRVKATSKPKSL